MGAGASPVAFTNFTVAADARKKEKIEGNQMSDHELREIKFRLKQANKALGQTGGRIHQLRAELAEVRALNSKVDRGELRRLQNAEVQWRAQFDRMTEESVNDRKRIRELEERLAEVARWQPETVGS